MSPQNRREPPQVPVAARRRPQPGPARRAILLRVLQDVPEQSQRSPEGVLLASRWRKPSIIRNRGDAAWGYRERGRYARRLRQRMRIWIGTSVTAIAVAIAVPALLRGQGTNQKTQPTPPIAHSSNQSVSPSF